MTEINKYTESGNHCKRVKLVVLKPINSKNCWTVDYITHSLEAPNDVKETMSSNSNTLISQKYMPLGQMAERVFKVH